MNKKGIMKNIVCFGEVLWDLLPTGAVPGGAPMNVAIRSQSFGMNAAIISRTGNDKCGEDLKLFINARRVNTNLLQKNETLPTGKVKVNLDENGIADYDIVYPSAWDKIELTDNTVDAVKNSHAFVFGSLACRDDISRNTLVGLLDHAIFKIFDVNLRPPFYSLPLLETLIRKSDLVKMNDEELLIIAKGLGSEKSELKENILFLFEKLNIESICVTRGKYGAVLFIKNEFYSHNGFTVEIADTVGSGDSFLAALITRLLTDNNHSKNIEFACAVGALVASKTGANPPVTNEEIELLLKQ